MSTPPTTTLATQDDDARASELGETLMGSEPTRGSVEIRTRARGSMVGRYIVLDTLGRGAMGIVYAAYDPELDRKVALKLLLPGRDSGVSARLRLQRALVEEIESWLHEQEGPRDAG